MQASDFVALAHNLFSSFLQYSDTMNRIHYSTNTNNYSLNNLVDEYFMLALRPDPCEGTNTCAQPAGLLWKVDRNPRADRELVLQFWGTEEGKTHYDEL